MKIKIQGFLIILMIHIPFVTLAGGTVVRDGGDPIFEFMEAARFSMIETIKIVVNDPDEQKIFCQQENLNSQQIQFCRNYFLSVSMDILRLSQGDQKTLLVLRKKPLEVIGPDGQPMMVAARTKLGPSGPIELHRDSVKTLIPTQVLFLLTHEFEHKANFNGNYVGDNKAIGPFANGRDLLDAVAKSVVSVARRKGLVGTQFQIRDIFFCTGEVNGVKIAGARLVSTRIFKSEDLMSYETSSGQNPSDGSISLHETNTEMIQLKFKMSEPNNCGPDHVARNTSMKIVRSHMDMNGDIQEIEELAHAELSINPMCPKTRVPFSVSWQSVRFECQYYGSVGKTD